MTDTLYEQDFFVWTQAQADALRAAARAGSAQPLDFEHLAEEIGDLGIEIRHKVESLTRQIMIHLLKLACSPAVDPRTGWFSEVDEFRDQLERRLATSPSLRSQMDDIVEGLWSSVLRGAVRVFQRHGETDAIEALDPWRARGITAEEVLTDGLYPEPGTTRFVLDAD